MILLASLIFLSAASASVTASFEDIVKMKWSPIEGKLREITMARDYDTGQREIFGVASNGNIWTCRMPCDGDKNKWASIRGSAAFIAANDYEVWMTKPDFSIWRCEKPCTGNWIQQPGQLRMVSMGSNMLWGVNHVDDMWRTPVAKGAGPSWQFMNNGNKFRWVSVGMDNDVWAILKTGEVVRFNAVNNSWKRVPGKGKRISVGINHLYLIDDNDQLMRCKRPCQDGKWVNVQDGKVRAVAAEWTKCRRIIALRQDDSIVEGELPKNCPKCCHSKSPFANQQQQQQMMSMMSPYYQYWQSYLMSAFNNQTAANNFPSYYWQMNGQQPSSSSVQWNYGYGQQPSSSSSSSFSPWNYGYGQQPSLWSAPTNNQQQQLQWWPWQMPWFMGQQH